MGNVLRFDSKREMDMMAAILIGKGKAIVPRKKRFVQNKARWEFSVNPAIRWSSQQKYKNEIIMFDQACATVNGISTINPDLYTRQQLDQLCNDHWVCDCQNPGGSPVIRSLHNDRCFKCNNEAGHLPSRYPEPDEIKHHLLIKYNLELETNASK